MAESAQRPWLLFEVTRRCNRDCVYCYAGGSHAGPELSQSRTRDILARLLSQVTPRGATLIGGEPLLLPALAGIARELTSGGLPVSVSTNALLLDAARLGELLAAGVTAFEVSYDSPVPDVYAALTHSRAPVLQTTLTALVRAGVSVTVGAMLTTANVASVEDLLRLCFAFGVRRVSLNQMALVGSALRHPEMTLSDGALTSALDRIDALARALGVRVAVGLPVEPCRLESARYTWLEFESCHCGETKWLIEPTGDVRVCELAPHAIGNLFETAWSEITSSPAVLEFRNARAHEQCGQCRHAARCGGGCRFRTPGSHAVTRAGSGRALEREKA